MVIREADGQFDISGSPGELNAVADGIERLADGAAISISAHMAADARPYARCLAGLEVRATGGPVRVALGGDGVVVTGSAEMLRAFASFFRFHVGASRGAHHHHEWFEGNAFIARDSVPVVVGVE